MRRVLASLFVFPMIFLLFLGSALPAAAQFGGSKFFEQAVETIDAEFQPATAKRGQVVTLSMTIKLAKGWHTYPDTQKDPQAKNQVNQFTFPDSGPVAFVGELQNPPDPSLKEERLGDQDFAYNIYKGQVTWKRKAVVRPDAEPGEVTIEIPTFLQVCDENGCLPPKRHPFKAKLTIRDETVAVPSEYRDALASKSSPSASSGSVPTSPPSKESDESRPVRNVGVPDAEVLREELAAVRDRLVFGSGSEGTGGSSQTTSSGTTGLLLTAAFWGFISLLTPCVFPMIPITISLFLKHGGQSVEGTARKAIIYCLTIIVVLGISAFALLSFFRALSLNPFMNLFLGGLFVFFALSLFGMYDITLPGFLQRFTSKREQAGGIFGTIFMALTFTIIGFTCVAPFLGGFAGLVASGQYNNVQLALAGFTFAAAFASPFFLLAIFPALLKQLPRSGSWMNTIKVVMGFLELAASLKFFRTAEIAWASETTLLTYEIVLCLWIAIGIICGLYLLNVFQLPHDSPTERIGVTRMLTGAAFIALSLYLLPAVFQKGPEDERQRPSGALFAWVDAFLNPDARPEANWSIHLPKTLAKARKQRQKTGEPQYVFVDFTGEQCVNCRINENNIFPKPTVEKLLEKYHLVKMYTDSVPSLYYRSPPSYEDRWEDARPNLEFQKQAFQDERLPMYVILEPLPDGKIRVVGGEPYVESKINDEPAFVEYLQKPFAQATQQARR